MSDAQDKYADIIDLPHPVSATHPPMAMEQRAAQFSPFAALAGHTDAIKQAAQDAIEHGPDAPADQSEFYYC
ncbi:MAG: hypothetical protein V8R08_02010 [Coriobacteriales bacterium]